MSDEFVINDKRMFNKDGQLNPDAGNGEAPKTPPREPGAAAGETPSFSAGLSDLPPANFAGLLIGLATSAFIHLGESPDPALAAGEVDLPAAKHSIDLLAVLQEKTRGNLEQEEEALLTTLLYDLRLRFVQASGGGK